MYINNQQITKGVPEVREMSLERMYMKGGYETAMGDEQTLSEHLFISINHHLINSCVTSCSMKLQKLS